MTGAEIRKRIDENNEKLQDALTPSYFVLNSIVSQLLQENKLLREVCQHKYENGVCIYCDKEEDDEE